MKYNRSLYHCMVRQSGFSILEVLIGIGIFAIGMLALAALQGALTRSTAEAKVRTEAVNIAEEIIEAQRGFSSALATAGVLDYEDIRSSNDPDNPWTSDPLVITRNNVTFSVTQEVKDYYYSLVTDSFTESNIAGVSTSDYKSVTVNVAWGDDREFVIQEGVETADNLGGGSVQISSIISVETLTAVGRVALESDQPLISPPVAYSPGLRPDVIALSLGESKFKEALTPEPEVVRNDQLVKTSFEVVTFSTSNGNEFLRREEFVVVPCECRLKGTGTARRPVIWAGDEYAGGHFVDKPYGEPATPNKSSLICETCCRDHHDGGSSTGDSNDEFSNVYGPFKKGTGTDKEYSGAARKSDHLHYKADGRTVAAIDDAYLEVCRMVRVDGFLSVAQDFRREDQYVFPADFLDINDPGDTEIDTYSSYITNAVLAYKDTVGASISYPVSSPPCIGIPKPPLAGNPTCVAVPSMQNSFPVPRGSYQLPSWTSLQTGVLNEQQLRSRGIYIDYMSLDLRKFISSCFSNGALVNDCCIRNGNVENQCTKDDLYMDKTGSSNILEILPFFEVQMTKLENWNQNPPRITLTNQAIADANAHSRGEAVQLVTKQGNKTTISLGTTEVKADSHRGNIGFTNTLAIDPEFNNQLKHGKLDVHSLDASGGGSTGNDPTRVVLIGQFSENVTGNPTIIVSGGGDATCSLTPGGYYCFYPVNPANPPKLIVEGYEDTHVLIPGLDPEDVREIRCAVSVSNTLIRLGGDATSTTFSLLNSSGGPLAAGTSYDIRIEKSGCGGGIIL